MKLLFMVFTLYSASLMAQDALLSPAESSASTSIQTENIVPTIESPSTTETTPRYEASPIFAYDPNEQLRDTSNDWVSMLGGIGVRQTKWKYTVDKNNTHSTYSIEDAVYTSYEGNLSFNRFYTRLGFSVAAEDELISNIKKYSGYLGLGRMLFRSESGKFKGSVDYNGFSTNNLNKHVEFDQKYSYAEALYFFKNTPFFAGIRRTQWKLPIEIVALKKDQQSGQTIFDRDFEFKYTSLSIGMDYMTQIMMNPSQFHTGWGIMGKVTGNYGWGKAKIGDAAAYDATKVYGGGKHFTETEFGMLTAEMEAGLGVMYAKAWTYARMVAGLGYNYNLFTISSMAKQASDATELQPVALVFFHNHGPLFRLQMLF